MKRKILLSIVLILALAFLAGCGSQEGSSEEPPADETMEPVILKFADFYPNTHPASVAMLQHWCKRVEEVTDGLVKVDYYPAGTLLKSGDIYEGVVSGVADVGHDVSAYNIGRLPVLNAMYVGGIEYESAKVASYVARDLVIELKPKELEDTRLMFLYGIAPGVLMTTKPVRTMEDLKGMQIRASGANVDTLESLGAVPVGITISETYDSMSKGVVDGALLPTETLLGFKLGEVTKYITPSGVLYNTVNYCTMNKDVWNSLPGNIQDKINKVNEEVFMIASELWSKEGGLNKQGLDFALENGNEVITLSEEEDARWKEKLKPLLGEYAKVLNEKGIDGQLVMDKIVALTQKYNNKFDK